MTKEERVSGLGMMNRAVLDPYHEDLRAVALEIARLSVLCLGRATTATLGEEKQENGSILNLERVGASWQLKGWNE